VRKATRTAVSSQALEIEKVTRRVLSGVATPAPPPSGRGGGRWEEGRWGLGPLALRDYRLFIPPGVSASRPAPLLMLLHGCGQDAASFAASTRAAALARAEGFAVLLPEQSSQASPQRCWKWFGAETLVAGEAMILMAIVDHISVLHPVRRESLFALGISAGGSMALTLALRYPHRFKAVGTHSGAVPHSAASTVQAGQTMRGRRAPNTEALRPRLLGRRLPPLIVLHGDADRVVTFENARATTALWLDLHPHEPPKAGRSREVQRGQRRRHTITDWRLAGKPYVRLIGIEGLGHAWSGGAPKQAFSDPTGPDALKLAMRFFCKECASVSLDSSALPTAAE
jgi:poly(3-hydroxybutyrate) depolymerase